MKKEIKYSWDDFCFDCDLLISKTISRLDIKTVVGVAFGGLPILTYLKNHSCKDMRYEIISASSYGKNKKRGKIKIEPFIPITWPSPILLLDEIVDSGNTLKAINEKLERYNKKIYTFSLFYKENKIFTPDFHIYSIAKKTWITMPWE